MRPKRGRLSLRDQLKQSHVGQSWYADMAGKPRPELPAELQRPVRQRSTPGADGRPLERHVLKTVIDALRYDRRVASVERNQSGVFQDGERYIRVGSKGKLDLTVYLRSGRFAEIEVKRDARTKPDERQLQRIEHIQRSGGIAGWCWDAPSALAILPK